MFPISILVLPFVLLLFSLVLLHRARAGWRAGLGAAFAGVASWFALFWLLICLAIWAPTFDSVMRSPRAFNESGVVLLLILGYFGVIVWARVAKKARAATLPGVVASGVLLAVSVALAGSLMAGR